MSVRGMGFRPFGGMGAGGGAGKFTPALQPVATKFFAPQTTGTVTSGKAQAFTRYSAYLCSEPVTEIRIAYFNHGASETPPTGGGSLVITNVALELDDGIVMSVPFTWSGSAGVTVVAGDESPLSDAGAVTASKFGLTEFPANSRIWFRTDATTTSTQWVFGLQAGGNGVVGEQAICATAPFAVQSGNTGQVSGLTGQVNLASSGGPHPTIVLGKTTSQIDSVIFLGDSIGAGTNDTAADIPVPIWGRGASGRMNSPFFGNANIPYVNICGFGEGITSVSFTKRAAWFTCGANIAIIEYGVNDMKSAPGTAAATLAANLSLAGTLKAAGIKYVFLTTITPYATSTDSYATVANQTAIDTTIPTISQQYNTLLASLNDARIDGIIDQGGAMRDATFNDRWKATYTGDGLHPLGKGMAILGPMTRTAVQSKGIVLPDPDYSWVRPNAVYDIDYKNDRYYGLSRYDEIPTGTRLTQGYATDPTFQKLYTYGPGVSSGMIKRIVPGIGLFISAAVINLFTSPFAPATQTATVVNATTYTVSIIGPGSIVLSGAGSGTVTAGNPVTFVASGTSLVATVSGSPLAMQLEASAYANMPVSGTSARDDTFHNQAILTGAAGALVVTTRSVQRATGAIFGQGGAFSVRRATPTTIAVINPTLTITLGSGTLAGRVATGMTWDAGGVSACANGGTVATTATALGVHTNWSFGGLGQVNTQIDDVVERITIFPGGTRLSDATLQAEAVVR